MTTSDAVTDRRKQQRLTELVNRLRRLRSETEWVEFKHNQFSSEVLGKTVSALANGARLRDQESAYLIWGVADDNRELVGTSIDPDSLLKGQPFQMWLAQHLAPSPVLTADLVHIDEKAICILRVSSAADLPVAFDRIPYIRIGSATPPLRDHPEVEKLLNAKLRPFLWETGVAKDTLSVAEVQDLLDIDAFFTLRRIPRPTDINVALSRLAEAEVVRADASGFFDISNQGALLLARDLSNFPDLSRKALRIVQYTSRNRLEAKPEQIWTKGYATGFRDVLKFLEGVLPAKEVIGASRTEERVYPSEAIKELLVNTLIHQDMTVIGAGPKVEIFSDRIEFTNPGDPVTDWNKLFGVEPRSRNERLANSMRMMDLCEERGLGLRRTITSTIIVKLIPPMFAAGSGSTKVTLFGHSKAIDAMDTGTKNRALYYLSMVLYENGERLTNSALRKRYPMRGNATVNASAALRVCKDAGFIKLADTERPNSGYVPFWA